MQLDLQMQVNAILMGGASLGKYNALNFSRKQENYADQAVKISLNKQNMISWAYMTC